MLSISQFNTAYLSQKSQLAYKQHWHHQLSKHHHKQCPMLCLHKSPLVLR